MTALSGSSILDNRSASVFQFLEYVGALEPGYLPATFSYVAIKEEGRWILLKGRLFLNNSALELTELGFESPSIRAGRFLLSKLGVDVSGFIHSALAGSIPTPNGPLAFPKPPDDGYSVTYFPLHPEGLSTQIRVSTLNIAGNLSALYVTQPSLDWELKANCQPYDSLQELLIDYRLGPSLDDQISIEALAYNVAAVHPESRVAGRRASIVVRTSTQAIKDDIVLGYRVYLQSKVAQRSTVPGSQFRWTDEQNGSQGEVHIDVEAGGAVLHCIVSYRGFAQQHWWVLDPENVQNPARVVYEAFDPKLSALRDFLSRNDAKGRDGRDFEFGVAWLLWMLGFSIAHIGGTARTSGAPDLIATTPTGHFAVVECTTGLLKAENKLAILVERSQIIRRQLDTSGSRHLRVLPVIVTSKSRDEVKADLEQAQRLGVLVVTRETLDEALNRTMVLPSAEAIYENAERELREALIGPG